MSKILHKYAKPDELVPMVKENARFTKDIAVAGVSVDTYDIDDLAADICLNNGIIHTPLTVCPSPKGHTYDVLQGNRRALAARKLASDADYLRDRIKEANTDRSEGAKSEPLTDEQLDTLCGEAMKNLERIPVMVLEGLTEKEKIDKINDHGGQKPTGKAETVKAIFDALDRGLSERQIISQFFHMLVDFAGSRSWVNTLAKTEPERSKQIFSKMHNHVGGFLRAIWATGSKRLRDATLRTFMVQDGLVKADDVNSKPEFTMTHTRWRDDLKPAIEQDIEKKVWNRPSFDKEGLDGRKSATERVIKGFIEVDAKGGSKGKNPNKISPKVLKDMTNQMEPDSPVKQLIERIVDAKGDLNPLELDKQLYTMQQKIAIIERHVDAAEGKMAKLLAGLLNDSPADFEETLVAVLGRKAVTA